MLKKLCSRCNKVLIPYKQKYCNECSKIVDQESKESYREYKQRRQDKKERWFYVSRAWIQLRQAVLSHYKGLDIYEYYVNHKIVYAEIVHHIRITKDMWDMRLVFSNMFLCSKVFCVKLFNP